MSSRGRPAHDPLMGQTLGGKYRLEGLLGRGGFGTVYRATQAPLGRAVAVKVMAPMDAELEAANLAERFEQEAALVARLSGPYTVTLYDYGVDTDGRLYMVLELVEGQSLAHRLMGGPMAWREVAQMGAQIAEALSEAHRVGIIHRDLKPANLMLTQDGLGRPVVKVLDFGIAKLLAPTARTMALALTGTGQVLGTPGYIAPEQLMELPVGPAADQYALGVVLYQSLSGRLPFSATSAFKLLKAQTEEPPAPLPAELDVPDWLRALVMRTVATDPADRYPTCAAVNAELTAGLSGELAKAGAFERTRALPGLGNDHAPRVVVNEPPTVDAVDTGNVPSVGRSRSMLIALGLLGLLAGLGIWWAASRPPDQQAPAYAPVKVNLSVRPASEADRPVPMAKPSAVAAAAVPDVGSVPTTAPGNGPVAPVLPATAPATLEGLGQPGSPSTLGEKPLPVAAGGGLPVRVPEKRAVRKAGSRGAGAPTPPSGDDVETPVPVASPPSKGTSPIPRLDDDLERLD